VVRLKVMISFLVVSALILGCRPPSTPAPNPSPGPSPTQSSSTGQPRRVAAPDFSTTDTQGNPVTLAGLKDKGAILLHFWSIGTPSNTLDMADIAVEFQRWGQSISFVSINVGDNETAVRDFVKEGNYQWVFAVDAEKEIAAAFGVERLPSLITIDRDGLRRFFFNGFIVRGFDLGNAINYTRAGMPTPKDPGERPWP